MKIIRDKHLLFVAIVICSFSESLKQLLFGIPIVHIGNLICVFLFIKYLIIRKTGKIIERDLLPFTLWFSGYILIGSLGLFVFKLSILQFLWGARTYFRMIALLMDCIMILEKEDLEFLYRIFNIVIVLHIVLTFIQFFILGIRWDYLNGIFGCRTADSSSLHALLIINSCLILYEVYSEQISKKIFLLHFTWMAYNAALSEIRGWFYEIVILFVVYLAITGDFKRMVKIFGVLVVIYISAAALMTVIYPYTAGFLGIPGFNGVLEEAHRIDKAGGIGRKDQIFAMTEPMLSYAKEKVGNTGILPVIIGLGLGSADYATVQFLNSEFYTMNEGMGYTSFLLSFIYVETGVLGLIEFNSMWIYLFYKGYCMLKKQKNEALMMILCAVTMAVTAFYNQTLRTNYGYIMWVFLGTVVVLTYTGRFAESNGEIKK